MANNPLFPGPPVPITDACLNLLAYNSAQVAHTDPQFNPSKTGVIYNEGIDVQDQGAHLTQFYWVMVSCRTDDPSSHSAVLALQYLPGPQIVTTFNPTFIPDLATLVVPGFFSPGFFKNFVR